MGRTRCSRRRKVGKGRDSLQKLRATARAQAYLADYKSFMGCAKCGETYAACLHLHHVDPSNKRNRKDSAAQCKTMASVRRQIAKCIVLCANCHVKVHQGFFDGAEAPVKKPIDQNQMPMFSEANGHDTTA